MDKRLIERMVNERWIDRERRRRSEVCLCVRE